jgi:peptidoglycan hydrolase-like protein with peptidoglycan-binding domain
MRRILIIGMVAALVALPLMATAQPMSPTPEGRSTEGYLIPKGAEPGRPSSEATPQRNLVRDAQIALRNSGYDPGQIDGVMGSRTRAALREFQASQGLPQTGRLDGTTQQQLLAANRPESSGRSGIGLAR